MNISLKNNKTSADNEEEPEILKNIASKSAKLDLKNTIEHIKNADEIVKQYEITLTTVKGYINEDMSQKEIEKNLDVSSQSKKMDLKLKYGPYFTDFTNNGQYLLIGGDRGQLGMMDWKSRKLMFDINVKEQIRAIKNLHRNTMVAVSQKDYTYVYDNEGKEMHCIRQIHRATHFEYLPYHFLLVAGTEKGFLNYLDTSTGSIVSSIPTFHKQVSIMCQNRWNAIIATGHNTGTVSMWSPNEKAPVMKMVCHEHGLRSIAIDHQGNYLVTAGKDRKMKIWDLRMTQNELADLRVEGSAVCVQFSQTGLLGVSTTKNQILLLKDVHLGCRSMETATGGSGSLSEALQHAKAPSAPIRDIRPLMSHAVHGQVSDINFCPYEDVMAIGTSAGVCTIFAPGSGEPNFDAFEDNPYAEKKFRNEQEVKRLLEKIPAELIQPDTMVSSVHLPSVAEQWEKEREKIFGGNKAIELKKKRNSRAKPKPKTQKDVNTKDNLYYERLVLQRKLHETENTSYQKKREYSRQPINSVLDNLIYKK